MSDAIRVEADERGVARLVLSRPDKHNAMSAAMSAAMMDALVEAVGRLGRDPSVRAVVLAGEGKSFCAGADLAWMRRQLEANAATRAKEAARLANMLLALNSCPKPLVGRVHGNVFGGGIGLISVCDVAVGSTGVHLGLTETRLGLTPATISPYVVARMGEAKARRVFMSGRVFGADEAVALGLLAKAVPLEDLDAAVEAEVRPYLSVAPGAVAEAKALVRSLGPAIDEAVIARTIEALSRRWESPEVRDGIEAFFARRPAPWA